MICKMLIALKISRGTVGTGRTLDFDLGMKWVMSIKLCTKLNGAQSHNMLGKTPRICIQNDITWYLALWGNAWAAH